MTRALLTVIATLMLPAGLLAQERFAVVVSGAAGGDLYAAQHHKWRADLTSTLASTFQFAPANISVLAEDSVAEDSVEADLQVGLRAQATAANVRRLFGDLRRRAGRDDVVLVILMGHGTFDGADAKFNLVGPDLKAAEWRDLLAALPARIVVINTTAASFPFLEDLSARGRVVITATDSIAQRFATVFPEYLVRALGDPGSDVDKDGRVSVWEAFAAASAGVKRHYAARGQLSTEHALLDDDGDRIGREAEAAGSDGALARTIYLNAAAPAAQPASATVVALEQQRRAIERQIEELKGRRAGMAPDQYDAELERLLVALARVAQQIRRQS